MASRHAWIIWEKHIDGLVFLVRVIFCRMAGWSINKVCRQNKVC